MARALAGLALGLLLVAAPSAAEEQEPAPLRTGDAWTPVSLEDAHGVAHTIGADAGVVIFSRDMDAGDVVEEALADDGATRLARAGAFYVADISRMPGLITRLFALPALRRRAYPMLLDRDGGPTAAWPSEPGRATWIEIAGGRVAAIRTTDDPAALRAALDAAGSRAESP